MTHNASRGPAGCVRIVGARRLSVTDADRSKRVLCTTSCLLFSGRIGATPGKARPIENSATGICVRIPVSECPVRFFLVAAIRQVQRQRKDCNDEIHTGDRRRLSRRPPGNADQRTRRVPLECQKVSHDPERPHVAVVVVTRGRGADGRDGTHAQRLGAARELVPASRCRGCDGAARAVGGPTRLLLQAHEVRPAGLAHTGPGAPAAPRRTALLGGARSG